MNRLAIIDWGIGGVSIYKLIKKRRRDLAITYLSDTGARPYGKMSRPELVSRLDAALGFLAKGGVTHVVIGCNAASTAIPFLGLHGLKVQGVIKAAIAMTLRENPQSLGLIGGRRTVLSGVYRKAFRNSGLLLRQRIAQPLSGMIEGGDVSSLALQTEAKRILAPLSSSTHILLACTHYPAIAPLLSRLVSKETKLIDPAGEMAAIVMGWQLCGDGADEFLTTGNPHQMRRSAKLAFDVEIGKVRRIKL
ncbi:MAG: aspartate/glutamate racemase family protein [Pyrinomonadaceae bacterium]